MSSGVAVNDECVEIYNQIKMKKDLKFIVFKIKDSKEIVVDVTGGTDKTYKDFADALPDNEPRYALIDVDYTTDDGRPQNKLTFVAWSPDDGAPVKMKMLYASSKDALKKKLAGIMKELQANEKAEVEEEELKKAMLK
eukprot:TRINITY_DN6527_c0_g1_i1.p2 TRINITY_DN6527_c0_g1~~TRINITY_DN6527_c0_g1_i1.p2  ORF type:complete len:138 (+),score=56.11 TRINITY_DN6527_c0_g1_i1:95-508(+)